MILCTPSHPLPHSFFKKNTPYITSIQKSKKPHRAVQQRISTAHILLALHGYQRNCSKSVTPVLRRKTSRLHEISLLFQSLFSSTKLISTVCAANRVLTLRAPDRNKPIWECIEHIIPFLRQSVNRTAAGNGDYQ